MARTNPWKVRKDTKSESFIIDFSYRDQHQTLKRFRRSAGKGVGKREAERKARELHREMNFDPMAVAGAFARSRGQTAHPFDEIAWAYF